MLIRWRRIARAAIGLEAGAGAVMPLVMVAVVVAYVASARLPPGPAVAPTPSSVEHSAA